MNKLALGAALAALRSPCPAPPRRSARPPRSSSSSTPTASIANAPPARPRRPSSRAWSPRRAPARPAARPAAPDRSAVDRAGRRRAAQPDAARPAPPPRPRSTRGCRQFQQQADHRPAGNRPARAEHPVDPGERASPDQRAAEPGHHPGDERPRRQRRARRQRDSRPRRSARRHRRGSHRAQRGAAFGQRHSAAAAASSPLSPSRRAGELRTGRRRHRPARYPAGDGGAAASLSVPADRPGRGAGPEEADRRDQGGDDQRALLPGPFPGPADHAGSASRRGDGAGLRRARGRIARPRRHRQAGLFHGDRQRQVPPPGRAGRAAANRGRARPGPRQRLQVRRQGPDRRQGRRRDQLHRDDRRSSGLIILPSAKRLGGDQAKHGGGVEGTIFKGFSREPLTPHQLTPPPPFGWSPSPHLAMGRIMAATPLQPS